MATETLAGPLGEVRAASTASGGTALTSTAARIVLPLGTKWVSLLPHTYAGAKVVRFNFNPWITVLKTTDLFATAAALTDYSQAAQDGSTSTDITLSGLAPLASSDALYVGSYTPFGGLDVDVDSTNSTASVLTGQYWNGTAWTDISLTDNTGGATTFANDGTITWTVPAAWDSVALQDAQPTTALKNVGVLTEPMYWVRLVVSVTLDASTTLNSMIAINRSTAYAELPAGIGFEESITVGPGGQSSVTALTDAGTASLIVNVASRQNGRFA